MMVAVGLLAAGCIGGSSEPETAVDAWFAEVATVAPAQPAWLSGVDLDDVDPSATDVNGLRIDGLLAVQAAAAIETTEGPLGVTPDRTVYLADGTTELGLEGWSEATIGSTLVSAPDARILDLITTSYEEEQTFQTMPGIRRVADALATHPVWYWTISPPVTMPPPFTETELEELGVPPLLAAYDAVGVGVVTTADDHRLIVVFEHDSPAAAAENRTRVEAQLASSEMQTGWSFDELYTTERIEVDGTRLELELVVLQDLRYEHMLLVRPSNLFMTAAN